MKAHFPVVSERRCLMAKRVSEALPYAPSLSLSRSLYFEHRRRNGAIVFLWMRPARQKLCENHVFWTGCDTMNRVLSFWLQRDKQADSNRPGRIYEMLLIAREDKQGRCGVVFEDGGSRFSVNELGK